MAKKTVKYWKDRFEALEDLEHQDAVELFEIMEKEFAKASKDIENKIEQWYNRVAVNNEISMADARKFLNVSDLKEFKWDVEDYIKYGEQNEVNQIWMKQLENASARQHISYLDSIKIQVQHTFEVLFDGYLGGVTNLARNLIDDSYYHTVYELQKGFNVGWKMEPFDSRRLTRIMGKPWTVDSKTFSDRIWEDREKLINEVHKELTQMTLQGGRPDQAIKNIAKKMNTSKNNAGRLVMTESAYFYSESQKEAYKDLDVERFQIVATLDSVTSDICQNLDLKIYEMKDYEVGVTAPPFHPWCRSVTVPYFDDDFTLGSRAARDEETGKVYYVPANMSYQQWYDEYVAA